MGIRVSPMSCGVSSFKGSSERGAKTLETEVTFMHLCEIHFASDTPPDTMLYYSSTREDLMALQLPFKCIEGAGETYFLH